MDGVSKYINREISWLEFGNRVLDIAENRETPLLERSRFLAIFAEGLDEFFQLRVAGLKDQVDANLKAKSPDGLTPEQQLSLIRERVIGLYERQESIFHEGFLPDLEKASLYFRKTEKLTDGQRQYLNTYFETSVFPILTPLAVDPGHPFPYISNLSLNLAVLLREPSGFGTRFARVKIPEGLPRFIILPDNETIVALEELIADHLDRLFPGIEIISSFVFRVTRNADLSFSEDEADDLLQAVELELRRRRFGKAVRLEIEERMSQECLDFLVKELDLNYEDVYRLRGPVDLRGLAAIYDINRPDLHRSAFKASVSDRLSPSDESNTNIFDVISRRDLLVQHPYESFSSSVQAFIEQSARDPQVLAIKQTLYRTSGDSPIVQSLISAAEAGKQVAAVVELKARFDEQANIGWAKLLEQAGVHVVYGVVGLKIHSKAILVVRQEGSELVRYCHIGTGNYNSKTARAYEDIGFFSADKEITQDVNELFNSLTGFSIKSNYRKLVVSPSYMKSHLLNLIEGEAQKGNDGKIVIKVNGLTHTEIIDALYEASNCGVSIDLIVRGICCLRPGVPKLSENIRVKSIVGRFLEHSRIFKFGNELLEDPIYLIGSADLMERNLEKRVETLVPITDKELTNRLEEILNLELLDDVNSWTLKSDGTWEKVKIEKGVNIHTELEQRSRERIIKRTKV